MSTWTEQRTSATLLRRLQDSAVDQEAWAELVRRYGPLVYRWCRHWQLQEADAQDVTQAVLARLVVRLRDFRYDPARSFRAYLRSIAGYVWRDLIDQRQKAGAGRGDTTHLESLGQIAARDDLARRLDEEFDREILDEAIARVRARVEPQTWEAFRLTAVEGLTGAAAAERLGMAMFAVLQAKNRVQKRLSAEVAHLEANGFGSIPDRPGGPGP
jgi:RNA polymerase sigma-70 factor (ECF subfamily)